MVEVEEVEGGPQNVSPMIDLNYKKVEFGWMVNARIFVAGISTYFLPKN